MGIGERDEPPEDYGPHGAWLLIAATIVAILALGAICGAALIGLLR